VDDDSATYEVELKFRLDAPDGLIEKLHDLNAVPAAPILQRDTYFAHPVRDFGETDEALRIRSAGLRNVVTYKGPLIDALSKTRREIEVAFAEGHQSAGEIEQILTILGFSPVRTVEKTRTPYHFDWENRSIELALDDVTGLGNFVELETISDASDREAARDALLRLAQHLGFSDSLRTSYLCLLLVQDTQQEFGRSDS
jgi:adenylate cyclase class 2